MSAMINVRVPDIGGAENVEVIELMVQPGESVKTEQGLITVETDKATMEIPAPQAGLIKEIKVEMGSRISQGDLIAMLAIAEEAPVPISEIDMGVSEEPSVPKRQSRDQSPLQPDIISQPDSGAAGAAKGLPYASPSIRKLARELEVPLANVTGTGVKGRITKDDVFAYVKELMSGRAPAPATEHASTGFPGLLPWPKVDFEQFGPIERRELPRIRKISGANLHRNWVTIPHVTNHEDADITELEDFRVQLNGEHAQDGVKVTLLAMLIKASVVALQKFRNSMQVWMARKSS
ncbi:hypothetical protein BG841_06000 [Marinobacter sp. X15-166B]|nr:biotin/lipoyl-containing protein [Marinobacter sp. X15-166B]OEY66054.1 hypothetical protein BG841_06000 [Marinobacter sp. X15-166B]